MESAINAGNPVDDFRDAGDGDLVRVYHRVHRRLSHGFTAAAENFQSRQPRLERPRQSPRHRCHLSVHRPRS